MTGINWLEYKPIAIWHLIELMCYVGDDGSGLPFGTAYVMDDFGTLVKSDNDQWNICVDDNWRRYNG